MAGLGARLVGLLLVAGAPAVPTSTTGLGGLVLSASLPGFATAPPGPTNGPLTASSFAAQSSDPRAAADEFAHAAAEPGFAAYLRLWTSTNAAAPGANDVAVELFRIPDRSREVTMLSELRQAYGGPGTSAFGVPGIPGAEGRSMTATQPLDAQLRVVTFSAGPYVAVVQVAARAAQNPEPVGTTQAVDVSTSQYDVLSDPPATPASSRSLGTPKGSSDTEPGAGGSSMGWWLLGALGALVVLAAVGWLVLQRRGRGGVAGWRASPPPTAADASEPADADDPGSTDGDVATTGTIEQSGRTTPVEPDPIAGAARPVPAVSRLDEPAPGTAAGWLPDPSGEPGQLRYWDGLAWTSHVARRTPVP